MLYVLASMLIMLALLDKVTRMDRLESLRLDTRFKLFALRDELRCAAINGDVPQNRWFEYLDTSITKMIDVLPHINFWEALALLYSHGGDKSILAAQAELSKALSQEENKGLGTIYVGYLACILKLLLGRHRTLVPFAYRVNKAIGRMADLKNRLAAIFTVAPETSTLLEHHS
jgi:hypothetical protein